MSEMGNYTVRFAGLIAELSDLWPDEEGRNLCRYLLDQSMILNGITKQQEECESWIENVKQYLDRIIETDTDMADGGNVLSIRKLTEIRSLADYYANLMDLDSGLEDDSGGTSNTMQNSEEKQKTL